MGNKAVGFYWTLPVTWAGFTDLPKEADAAAEASRTIHYQRALVRRYAAKEKWEVVEEITFLEIEPDRASDEVAGAMKKAARACRKHEAVLLAVDFTVLGGSRKHQYIADHADRLGIELVPIAAEPIKIDGEIFDPAEHFSRWKRVQREWSQGKLARQARLGQEASVLRDLGLTWPQIAAALDAMGIPSATGKPHTADSVRAVANKVRSR